MRTRGGRRGRVKGIRARVGGDERGEKKREEGNADDENVGNGANPACARGFRRESARVGYLWMVRMGKQSEECRKS